MGAHEIRRRHARVVGQQHVSGATTVNNGILRIDGTQTASAITVQSTGTLQGSGTLGTVTVSSGATINPGGTLIAGSTTALLTAANVTFNAGSTFAVDLNGTIGGPLYDRLASTSTVALGGASLDVTLGFTPGSGTSFLIVSTLAGTTGTFIGLPEGSSFLVGTQSFQITYAGGDGNDVVITAATPTTPPPTPPPPTPPPGPPPPTPPPAPTAPTVSPIPPQTLPSSGAGTVSFSVGGGTVNPAALTVTVSSSDPALLPATGLQLTNLGNGQWQLAIRPVEGGRGAAVVTLTVSDGTQSSSSSFVVAVGPSGPPQMLSTTLSGSGVIVMWSPPAAGPAGPYAIERYAIAGGTTLTGADLPVILTPNASTSYTFPALPSGTYYFRVYAIGPSGISDPGLAGAAIAHGAPVPGPITAMQGALVGTIAGFTWTPSTPASTLLEIGSAPGATNFATFPTAAVSFTADVAGVAPGTYWLRARSAAGSAVGAASNDVAITIGSTACTVAPGMPTLLPVTIRAGQLTVSWIPTGAVAHRYRVDVLPGIGAPAIASFATPGPVSSLVLPTRPGTFALQVVAENDCGASLGSNAVVVTIP